VSFAGYLNDSCVCCVHSVKKTWTWDRLEEYYDDNKVLRVSTVIEKIGDLKKNPAGLAIWLWPSCTEKF